MIKRIAGLAAVVIVGLASSAFAADLPRPAPFYTAPAYVAPATDWSGFYAGLSVGYDWAKYSNTSESYFFGNTEQSAAGKGLMWGGQVGYLRQYLSGIVFGLESDLYLGGAKGTHVTDNCPGCGPYYSSVTTDKLQKDLWGSTRAVLGYSWKGLMPYVTGGVAYARATDTSTTNSSWFGMANNPYVTKSTAAGLGWTLGGGIGYKLSSSWSARAQYLYTKYDFAQMSDPYSRSSSKMADQAITFGVNYHFNGL